MESIKRRIAWKELVDDQAVSNLADRLRCEQARSAKLARFALGEAAIIALLFWVVILKVVL